MNLPKENYHEKRIKKKKASLCPITYGRRAAQSSKKYAHRFEWRVTTSAEKLRGLPLQESRNEFEDCGFEERPSSPSRHSREILGAELWKRNAEKGGGVPFEAGVHRVRARRKWPHPRATCRLSCPKGTITAKHSPFLPFSL